ncbi:enoyl-CoA hydratase/isomerase family protein [Pseudooceanicola sp. LIPI14-2-Ac024]|uniref:enoyl-CoA hydratase/isomerase family protein n=1 Tax=Pseudooceanicola sp. LIPI14-2-Ac024 TaxID=3344875 RepID=UPI0035D0F7E8
MSDDIHIRREGKAGRITLTRPKALNALSYDMAMAIDRALIDWASDDAVALVLLDAEGEKAFCAGGDVRGLYDRGIAGDLDYARTFWRDEYRMNARMAEYGKPIVAFMQGFVMGGGVGIGCHASHRVVGETTRMAMPECGIGLIPDVGGSLLLARAPGRLGEYLALTTDRMDAPDAIRAGFADHYLPEGGWDALKSALVETGDLSRITAATETAPAARLAAEQNRIDRIFATPVLPAIIAALEAEDGDFADATLAAIRRNSPISMAATLLMLAELRRSAAGIREALQLEYRFTARSMTGGDFLEGIRAQLVDRDRTPKWKHGLGALEAEASAMIAPLEQELTF